MILDNFYNLKSLTIKKVEFKGVNSVLALGNEVIDKKEFTKTVTFTEVPRCKCYSENKTNEFKCPNNPKSPNCGTHLSTVVVGPGLNPQVENGATVNTLKCKNIVIISAFFLFL